MEIKRIDHYSIRTLDVEASRRFYTEIIGLKVGPRPPFDFPGVWLYKGEPPANLDNPENNYGIVHVMGPELGIVLPGLTVICGDSHTCTNGGLGAMAFGVGSSESTHALATQTLRQQKPKRMRIRCEGTLPAGVTAKDLALAIIGQLGTGVGTGHVIEFSGSAIRGLSMEGRMTLCNMAIEAGARAGMVAPDEMSRW